VSLDDTVLPSLAIPAERPQPNGDTARSTLTEVRGLPPASALTCYLSIRLAAPLVPVIFRP